MSELYQRLTGFQNLCNSFTKARRGKRGKASVARFEHNLENEIFLLQDELLTFSYQPGAYRSFYRTEAKRRLISAAPFRDRVVHHALVNVTQDLFERKFIYDSYANRVGKGTHKALDRCTQFMRSNQYVLPCDVRQFFPSIDHEILRRQLSKVTPQDDLMWLVEKILQNGVGVLDEMYQMVWFPGDDLFAANRMRGLPLGNLTSQFWANIYLNDLDQFIKRQLKCRNYLRYVDDFLLFSDDKNQLHAWRKEIVDYLAQLRLTIHEESAQPRPCAKGLTFLGFIVYPDHRRLKPRNGYAFRRRLKTMALDYHNGKIRLDKVSASVTGWIGHVAHADTWGLRTGIFSQVIL